MTSRKPPPDPQMPPLDAPTEAAMRDWMTIWQSEIAAMGVDREMQECWARMAEGWTEAAARSGMPEQFARMMAARGAPADEASRSPRADEAPRGARADAATRPAPAADAPDAGADVAGLRRELAEIRARIERLEATPGRRRRSAVRA